MAPLAKATNHTWPFVAIPDFAARAKRVRTLSYALLINTYYKIEEHERKVWERFTATKQAHS